MGGRRVACWGGEGGATGSAAKWPDGPAPARRIPQGPAQVRKAVGQGAGRALLRERPPSRRRTGDLHAPSLGRGHVRRRRCRSRRCRRLGQRRRVLPPAPAHCHDPVTERDAAPGVGQQAADQLVRRGDHGRAARGGRAADGSARAAAAVGGRGSGAARGGRRLVLGRRLLAARRRRRAALQPRSHRSGARGARAAPALCAAPVAVARAPGPPLSAGRPAGPAGRAPRRRAAPPARRPPTTRTTRRPGASIAGLAAHGLRPPWAGGRRERRQQHEGGRHVKGGGHRGGPRAALPDP
jgi:hypothetical protein